MVDFFGAPARGAQCVLRAAKGLAALAVASGILASTVVPALAAEGPPVSSEPGALHWGKWRAENEILNMPSLQRGARNFMAYCSGCHSLKYMRYARLAEDLKIPEAELELLPGDKKNDYILTRLPAVDGEAWFGKAPPDLSLIARSKGTDYVYQFMKTFYVDEKAATGVNNLALAGTAMPHVLSDLQGVQEAVFRNEPRKGEKGPDGKPVTEARFFNFEQAVPGVLSPADYDAFVRDTVNFLDYVGEPSQAKRQSLGVWVILFLLVFTGIAYLLKQEYWKDVPVSRH
jgi:ubiquinol-cytochrome c reductase cytochrome c1 subunit